MQRGVTQCGVTQRGVTQRGVMQREFMSSLDIFGFFSFIYGRLR